jgi:hypothetical protein
VQEHGNAYGKDKGKGKGKAKGRAARAGKGGPPRGRALGWHKDDPVVAPCAPAGAPAGDDASGAPPAEPTVPTVATFPSVTSPQAQRASRCVATPRRMRVVRGEQSAVRVVVAQNGHPISGAAVRVTTPDGTVVKRTDRHGAAVFYVRPSRTGQLVIQSDVCFGADRVVVLGARATGRRAARPQFTG